jgi:hypothetical protein
MSQQVELEKILEHREKSIAVLRDSRYMDIFPFNSVNPPMTMVNIADDTPDIAKYKGFIYPSPRTQDYDGVTNKEFVDLYEATYSEKYFKEN